MKTIKGFCRANGLSYTVVKVKKRPDNLMSDSAYHYLCVIRSSHTGNAISLYFSGGSACFNHGRGKPTLADIMQCVQIDVQCGSESYGDYCSNFGYSLCDCEAMESHKACVAQREKMVYLVGEEATLELQTNVSDD